jgi:hypothetical protein
MENGFNMWSFNGKLLYSMPRDRFQQLSWRPRVPSLLSKEKEEEIRKNLKDYSRWGQWGGRGAGGGGRHTVGVDVPRDERRRRLHRKNSRTVTGGAGGVGWGGVGWGGVGWHLCYKTVAASCAALCS